MCYARQALSAKSPAELLWIMMGSMTFGLPRRYLPIEAMPEKKRHHYIPKAYLKAFHDSVDRVLVYRKDNPAEPLHVSPDATQFRRYYYSQTLPSGGTDNNTLEDFFSTIEGEWPETVSRLLRGENVNDKLEHIFQFIALQRVRVPASRDAVESMLGVGVKDTIRAMLKAGKLPPPPKSLKRGFPDNISVSIDPQRSIHAMGALISGMAPLFSSIGLGAIHNTSSKPFLTNDNPVMWFDPSVPFEHQRPYTIRDSGPVVLLFPVSPKLLLMGSNEYKEGFGLHGLSHAEVSDDAWVDRVNAQTCRFGYEAVIAQSRGQESLIAEYAAVSPVHDHVQLLAHRGAATLHRYAFGPRVAKPKWRGN